MENRPQSFNIIDITLVYINPNEEKIHGTLILERKKYTFDCQKREFLEKMSEVLKTNRKKIKIFCIEPAILLTTILSCDHDKKKINLKYTIAKLEVYGFEIEINDKIIQLQNLNKIISEGAMQEISPNFNFKPLINYTLNEEMLRYTLPEGIPGWEEFKNQKILERNEIYSKESAQIRENIENNINAINQILKVLDSNLSLFLRNWTYYLSISSISINIFANFFNQYKVELAEKTEWSERLREGLFGGRCEVLGNPYGKMEKILFFDFPSMYLNVMKESEFPTGNLSLRKDLTDTKTPGFYRCRVFSDIELPVLPSKLDTEDSSWEITEQSKKTTVFGNGEFEGIYYYEELNLFIERGGKILELKEGWVFDKKKEPIFRKFATNILEYREIGNSKIWKSIGVSLYGRLGMKESKTETIITDNAHYKEDSEKKNIIKERWVGDLCFLEVEKTNKKKFLSNVQYAIIIASLARIKLYRNIEKLLNNDIRVLYCDTDSIFISTDANRTGKEEIENITWDFDNLKVKDAVFANTRTYSILYEDNSWETKISGTRRNAVDFKTFKKKFYSWEHGAILTTNWKKNLTAVIEWSEITIINLHKYKKRSFSADRKKTFPLILTTE